MVKWWAKKKNNGLRWTGMLLGRKRSFFHSLIELFYISIFLIQAFLILVDTYIHYFKYIFVFIPKISQLLLQFSKNSTFSNIVPLTRAFLPGLFFSPDSQKGGAMEWCWETINFDLGSRRVISKFWAIRERSACFECSRSTEWCMLHSCCFFSVKWSSFYSFF